MILRDWLTRNSDALGAVGAIATAFAALTALVVIPYQVAQADRIQREQTAREIYREFLNLTVQKPELATAYSAYVAYLIYTAEQMIDTSEAWRRPMANYLEQHKSYLCSDAMREGDPELAALAAEIGLSCTAKDQCQ